MTTRPGSTRGCASAAPSRTRRPRSAAKRWATAATGAGLEHGEPPEEDPSLEHPRCVFQLLKRHFSRYTPECVAEICGCSREQFLEVAEALCENSGRERTSAFCYAVGWTQHTIGVQIIRTAAIIQLLLGNMGRTGGGIMALRGHASIQGSTDIPTLFNILPGYIPMAHAHAKQTLADFVEKNASPTGWWGRLDAYMVSLLKAYFGARATAENDFCFDYLPRIDGDHSTYQAALGMLEGKVKGFFLFGENPAVGSANSRLHRMAMANLDWLVVRDLVEIESASFWHDAPELETGELKTDEIATEVFLLPAASHVEKSGSFTNTQRLLQWHFKAVEPSGDCRSDLWFVYHLGLRIREKLAGSDDPRDRPLLDLEWRYPTEGPLEDPSADAVLREISGWDADGRAVSSFSELKPDGSTVCGCWIYSGCYADEVNQSARKKPGQEQTWVAPEWGWAWPSNRRILYNRASADPSGRPWSERKRYVWWDEQQERWVGHDVPDFAADKRPDYVPPDGREGRRGDPRRPPVHHAGRRTRLAVRPQRPRRRAVPDALRATGVAVPKPALRPAVQPRAQAASPPPQPVQPDRRRAGSGCVPLRAHDLPADRAPHRRRHDPDRAVSRRDPAGDVLRSLSGARR